MFFFIYNSNIYSIVSLWFPLVKMLFITPMQYLDSEGTVEWMHNLLKWHIIFKIYTHSIYILASHLVSCVYDFFDVNMAFQHCHLFFYPDVYNQRKEYHHDQHDWDLNTAFYPDFYLAFYQAFYRWCNETPKTGPANRAATCEVKRIHLEQTSFCASLINIVQVISVTNK